MNDVTKPYSVCLWGSNPDLGNDDCHTGEDFATLEEAVAVYTTPFSFFKGPNGSSGEVYYSGELWVELDGPDAYEVRQVSRGKKSRRDDDDGWRSERAWQAGMMGGVEAYNEEMGF